MFAPILVTPPAAAPVSLPEVKGHLRVEHGEDDLLISGMLDAAVRHLDGWSGVLGRALVTQSWRQDFPRFAPLLRLPLSPAASVTSVSYIDPAGASQVASASLYELHTDDIGAAIALRPNAAWPQVSKETHAPVAVTFVCGTDAADVPSPLRIAIMLMIGDMYANRETSAFKAEALPSYITVERLITPYRRVVL